MKKRLLVFSLAFLFTLGAGSVGIAWMTAPRHRIDLDSFAKIEHGMTVREVEEVLGVPAGDYRADPSAAMKVSPGTFEAFGFVNRNNDRLNLISVGPAGCVLKEWIAEGVHIEVWFDEDGLVAHSRCTELVPAERSIIARVRRWLGFKGS